MKGGELRIAKRLTRKSRRPLALFKPPAYDPFAITVLGFGVLLVAILTFAY